MSKLAACIRTASFFLFLSLVRRSIHCFLQEDLTLFLIFTSPLAVVAPDTRSSPAIWLATRNCSNMSLRMNHLAAACALFSRDMGRKLSLHHWSLYLKTIVRFSEVEHLTDAGQASLVCVRIHKFQNPHTATNMYIERRSSIHVRSPSIQH